MGLKDKFISMIGGEGGILVIAMIVIIVAFPWLLGIMIVGVIAMAILEHRREE